MSPQQLADEQRQKISAILNWSETREGFDATFVNEMSKKLEKFGELTVAQEKALDRIIEGFKIDVEEFAD